MVTEVVASNVTGLTFSFADVEADVPPGGEPFAVPQPQDNNVLAYAVSWGNAEGKTQIFQGLVTLRSGVYSHVGAGSGPPADSGTGLELPGSNTSPPPANCFP